MIGEEIDHLVGNVAMVITEDMEEVRIVLEEVVFEASLVIILDGIVVEVERKEDHGDSLDQEKEEGELGQNQVLDQV